MGERNVMLFDQGETMRNALVLAIIVIGSAVTIPTIAAPLNDRDAYAAQSKRQTARANVRAECVRQANAKKFGMRFIQRRLFLRDCMMKQGFR
jgi:hypothetical protein